MFPRACEAIRDSRWSYKITPDDPGTILFDDVGFPRVAAQVGRDITEEEGVAAARLVALNMLATLKCEPSGRLQQQLCMCVAATTLVGSSS